VKGEKNKMELKEAIGTGIILGVTAHTLKSLKGLSSPKKRKRKTKRKLKGGKK